MVASSFGLVDAVPEAAAAAGPSAAKPVTGGTFTLVADNEIASLDPVRNTIGGNSQGGDRVLFVFGTLMRINTKTGALLPGLAESVTTNDAQNWTLKLRPDLKFSDGTPLDAEAVIFNYNRFKDPANTFTGLATVAQITKMTAVDPTTVEFKLVEPNGSFGMVFTDVAGAMGSPTAIKADPRGWGQKPIGAGPYILKEWVRDQQMTYVRNPTYYDKPRPYIDTMIYKILPNAATRINAMVTGAADSIYLGSQAAGLPEGINDPKKFRSVDPAKSAGSIGMACNLERTPCNDIRFREALSLSIDFNLVKQVFMNGSSYKGDTLQCMPFGPGQPACAKDIKLKFNPTRAKKLVDAVKADGISTDVVYTYNLASAGEGTGEFVQQQLAKIGVKVDLRPLTTNEYVAATNQHNFQLAIVYNPSAVDMGVRFYNDWHSVGGPKGGRDVPNLNNAALDVALEKGRSSIKLADRIAGWQEAQRIVAENFLLTWYIPTSSGPLTRRTLQLPEWVNPSAAIYRYEEAWLKPNK